jgi:hypothetical protein
MTDLPSSLGIEAVELLTEGAGAPRSVTVRVTGRWRRRWPELRGQAMLVFDGPAGRQRFLATPEPPSLTGAAPGTWRMSFSVPADLAPALPGRTFLQLGGVMVPLPIGDVVQGHEPTEGLDPELLEARRVRSSELAAEGARRRVAELGAQVQGLEHDVAEAREESERLRATIAERERRLRSARQDVHAEQAVRAELEQELSRHRRAARHDLAVLHERVADLERELTRMRRVVDEAGHLAAAADAARAEAERRLAERRAAGPEPPAPAPTPAPTPPVSPAVSPRAASIRRELDLGRATPGGTPGPPHSSPEHAGDRIALRQETAMADARGGRVDAYAERMAALAGQLAAALAEIERQRAEIEATKDEIEAQRRRTARAYEAIEFVRGELRRLHDAAPETTPSPATPARSVPLAPPTPPAPPASPASPTPGPVEAERLSEALARLRERTPAAPPEDAVETAPSAQPPAVEPPAPQPAPPSRPVRPWMGDVFRALARRDASTAGHLLLALLPAQRVANPHPVAYDLGLSDILWAHVTVDSATTHVQLDSTPRPRAEVDFQLVGDLASIARLLATGPVQRWLAPLSPGRRFARVRGDRRRIPALDRLLSAPLALRDLAGAGVELDPLLALTVAATMIEPGWTWGEGFPSANRDPAAQSSDAFLQIRDGRAPLASADGPRGPVWTVIVCAPREFTAVLAGLAGAPAIEGDPRPLSLLLQWLERAQCG